MITNAINIAMLGFRRWGTNIRYPLLLVLLFIFLWWILDPVKSLAYQTGYATNLFMLPFVASAETSQLIFFAGALFLFANAPFSDEMQMFVMFRTGRRSWVLGQIFYIAGSAVIYVAIIFLFSIIILAPIAMVNTDDWGKIVGTLCYTNAGSTMHLGFSVSEKIVSALTPLSALGFQLVLEAMSVAVVGLIVFLVNLISPVRIGLFIGGILVLLDLLITNIMSSVFFAFSPVSLARLSVLDFSGTNPFLPDLSWALCFDAGILIALIIAVLAVAKRITIEVIPDL